MRDAAGLSLPEPHRVSRAFFAPYLDRTINDLPPRFGFLLSAVEAQGYDVNEWWEEMGGLGLVRHISIRDEAPAWTVIA